MKFGKGLHQHRVAEWEQHYLPYKLLKALLKSATTHATPSSTEPDLREFYACFNANADAVDAFFHGQYACLRRKETANCERYSLRVSDPKLSRPERMSQNELEYTRTMLEELQQDYLKLHWFSRLNEEATLRIYAKLDRMNESFGQPHSSERQRRLEQQQSREKQCLDRIETLRAAIDKISRAYQSLRPSAVAIAMSPYSDSFDDQVPDALLNAVNESIRSDQASDIINALTQLHSILDLSPEKLRTLFAGTLTSSVASRAWECASALVAEKSDLVDHKLLNHLVDIIGKSGSIDHRVMNKVRLSETVGQDLREMGTNLFLHCVEHLGPRSNDVLWTKDAAGCLPLHYAAKHALATICHSILRSLSGPQLNTSAKKNAILASDTEGSSPLHQSVLHGHVEITQLFLDALDSDLQTRTAIQDQDIHATLNDLLLLALRKQNDDIVRLLASSQISLSHQSSRGETGLYVAAQLGREDYVTMLLEVAAHQKASIDIAETTYKWTPLFIASVEGHLPVVELLLQAGANKTPVDHLGWTAMEQAAFRGHLWIADRLKTNESEEAAGELAPKVCKMTTSPKYRYCSESTHAVVNLGVMQREKQIEAIDLNYSLPGLDLAQPNSTLSLELSTPAENNTSHLLHLPLLDDPVDETFVFPIENLSQARLTFKLFRADSTRGQRGTLVGSGTALLQDDRNCFGAQRESLVREQSVPILEKDTMEFLGAVTFTFVLARPFPRLKTPTSSIDSLKKTNSVQLIGHRGTGQNLTGHEYLQLGENTVESFRSAAKLGATHVEFDVQVTRDLVPVLYHNSAVSESGTDVPIHDMTLNQFMYASQIQSPWGDPVPASTGAKPQTAGSGFDQRKPRSRSLAHGLEKEAIAVQDRMKYSAHYSYRGFIANTRGVVIQDSFATLEAALREVPESIGFDIELKYPRLHEARSTNTAPVIIELNTWLDAALTTIARFAGARNIILSSFTPEVCILLALKQRAYPVLFITNAGRPSPPVLADKEFRAASLQVAVRFATQWGLAGIVFASNVLVLCPRLVGYVKRKGLVCGTYGLQNNVPELVELQAKAGVDLIVADRVGLISKTLKSLSLQNSS